MITISRNPGSDIVTLSTPGGFVLRMSPEVAAQVARDLNNTAGVDPRQPLPTVTVEDVGVKS